MTNRRTEFPHLWQRLGALVAAGLVLALGILAASPGLHAELHESTASHCADHAGPGDSPVATETCAVELFVAGLGLPVLPPQAVPAPVASGREPGTALVEVWYAESPHRQPPGRGPPQG